jgi:hypothetical protein
MDEEELEAQRQEIIQKWSSLGFLEGLNDDTRNNIETLYENQANTLINETQPETESGFENVAFPIVRRVFARLASYDIVSYNIDWEKADFKPYNKIKKHDFKNG